MKLFGHNNRIPPTTPVENTQKNPAAGAAGVNSNTRRAISDSNEHSVSRQKQKDINRKDASLSSGAKTKLKHNVASGGISKTLRNLGRKLLNKDPNRPIDARKGTPTPASKQASKLLKTIREELKKVDTPDAEQLSIQLLALSKKGGISFSDLNPFKENDFVREKIFAFAGESRFFVKNEQLSELMSVPELEEKVEGIKNEAKRTVPRYNALTKLSAADLEKLDAETLAKQHDDLVSLKWTYSILCDYMKEINAETAKILYNAPNGLNIEQSGETILLSPNKAHELSTSFSSNTSFEGRLVGFYENIKRSIVLHEEVLQGKQH